MMLTVKLCRSALDEGTDAATYILNLQEEGSAGELRQSSH
jgi:hypothetical protein